jgi:hypothetical protein
VQIRQWGLDNFYISADRVVRKFAEECKIQRISEEEITFRNLRKNGSARIAWYKI